MNEIFDSNGNWCPDCGEPRGVCQCLNEQPAKEYDAIEQRAQEILASCFNNAHVLARTLAISEVAAAKDKDLLDSLRQMLKTTRAVVSEKQVTIDRNILEYAKLFQQYWIAVEALQEISIIAFSHGGVCKPEVLEGIIDDMQKAARKALKGEK